MLFGELFKLSGSDKQGVHDYGPVYDELFPPASRESVKAVLELGAGPSLRAWQAAFPNAVVVALDANRDAICQRWALDPGSVSRCDLGDRAQLEAAVGANLFDLIVDDGSHLLTHQILAWCVLMPRLAPGGRLVIEDVQSEDDLRVLSRLPGAVMYDRRASGRYDDLIVAFSKPS